MPFELWRSMSLKLIISVLYPTIQSLINPSEHWFIMPLLIEVSFHTLAATFLFNNRTFQFKTASTPRLGPIIILVSLASPFFSASLKCKRILKWIVFINSESHHDEFYSVAAPFVLELLTIIDICGKQVIVPQGFLWVILRKVPQCFQSKILFFLI